MEFNTTTAMLGAAGVGIATACWQQLRDLGSRLMGLMIVRVTVDGLAQRAVETYCWNKLSRTPSSFRAFTGFHLWVRPLDKNAMVVHEKIGDKAMLFWKGKRPLLVAAEKEKKKGGGSPGDEAPSAYDISNSTGTLTLTFIRGTFDPEKLLVEAARVTDELEKTYQDGGRFFVSRYYGQGPIKGRMGRSESDSDRSSPRAGGDSPSPRVRPLGWALSELGPEAEGRGALDRMALEDHVQDAVTEMKRWLDSKAWYKSRQIAWRRGWLVHGRPGTGKSTLIKSLAQAFDMPLLSFDLGSMDNTEFSHSWSSAVHHSPAIVLLEDFDAVFRGRENVLGEMGGGLTFDCVLNTIAGVENTDGIFVVVTTNDISAIDDALGNVSEHGAFSTRPGRLDRTIELRELTPSGRLKVAQRILKECKHLIEQVTAEGANDTGAQFQERCVQAALSDFWTKQRKEAA